MRSLIEKEKWIYFLSDVIFLPMIISAVVVQSYQNIPETAAFGCNAELNVLPSLSSYVRSRSDFQRKKFSWNGFNEAMIEGIRIVKCCWKIQRLGFNDISIEPWLDLMAWWQNVTLKKIWDGNVGIASRFLSLLLFSFLFPLSLILSIQCKLHNLNIQSPKWYQVPFCFPDATPLHIKFWIFTP